MASSNPRILPAPTRPIDNIPPSPANPDFPISGPSKRKTEASAAALKKRARVSYSCQECHRRKQKCDRQVPCGHCVARKVPELCKNYQPGKTEDFNARLSRIEQIIEAAFPQYATGEDTAPPSPRDFGSFSGTLPGLGQWPPPSYPDGVQMMDMDGQQDGSGKSPTSSRSESPKPEGYDPSGGMLASGKWFGTSALASVNSRPIIDQLQQSTAGHAQPIIEDQAEVNDKLKSLIQDCGVPPHKLSELVQELPPRSLSDVLIDYYFTSVNYTRYPLNEPSFRAAYESICTNGVRVHPTDIRFIPLLFVVLAIAARLAPESILGDDRQKRMTALRYYWSSRRSILIAAAVHTDSFELILTRLLSVRFLTFDRRITECWAQLGAAIRTAQAIGLHRDPAKLGLDAFQTEYRRRVWSYLYHADSTFALLLGRPRTICDTYCDTLPPLNIDDEEILDYIRAQPPQLPGTVPSAPIPPLQGHPAKHPSYTTFSILRHALATIMGHIVHHFQVVRHHSHYSEVLALDEELQNFVKNLPPHYGLEPDTSLDADHPYLPVHRFLIVTEVFFVRTSLHRPYILRKLSSDRFNPSRRACFESAKKDFQVRQNFKRTMPRHVVDSLGGAYREFQAAMISGIALVIDPHGPDAPAMHEILDSFLRDHGVGEGAPPMLKEVDDTTKREMKIIEFLSQKAKSAAAEAPRMPKKDDGEDEEEGEGVSAERSSTRSKRSKRSIASAADAGLLLGISQSAAPSGTATPVGSSHPSFGGPGHSRTPSNIAIPRGNVTGSPMVRTPIDTPSPKFGPQQPPNMSPSYVRMNPPPHLASPRLIDLAQRSNTHESASLGSGSPSADESAQKLLDNWCNSVNSFEAGSIALNGFEFGNSFGGGLGPGINAPLWGGPLMNAAFPQGLGLVNAPPLDPNGPGGVAEVSALNGDGADYMYWDTLVQQIRGGVS